MSALKLQTLKITQAVSLAGRDEITLSLDVVNGEIKSSSLTGRGCPEMLATMQAWRPKLSGDLKNLGLPQGDSHSEILLREAILKAKGEWDFPYKEEELCHCRAIATSKVDAAIIGGCRSVRAIARETSAGTSCGSCRVETEAIINYRLGKKTDV
jgi:bacterioferritin-associated ferredoxin